MSNDSFDRNQVTPRHYDEPDRENSLLESDSDSSTSLEGKDIETYTRHRTPISTQHVIQFKAPNSEATKIGGNKEVSRAARRAVKKRREAQREKTKQNITISRGRRIKLSTAKLKSGSPSRGRSLDRSGKFKKLIRRSFSLKSSSSDPRDTDGISVCSSATTGSRRKRIFSRLGSPRRSKSLDGTSYRRRSTSSWGKRVWQKWRKNSNKQSTEIKPAVHVEQRSPTNVRDFVETDFVEPRELKYKQGKKGSWLRIGLCASMEPVILCKDYFCASEDESIGKMLGSGNDSGIIQKDNVRNRVRFEREDLLSAP